MSPRSDPQGEAVFSFVEGGEIGGEPLRKHGKNSGGGDVRTAFGTGNDMRALIGALSAMVLGIVMTTVTAEAQQTAWVVSWAASIQGPYQIGNPSAQPDMSRAFPLPAAGARDQSFRLIVRPTLWGRETRIRLSNALGTKPVTFGGRYSVAPLARFKPRSRHLMSSDSPTVAM